MEKDYYSVLGIPTNSTEQEIKKAYRKLSKKFHPDKNPNDPFFENLFKEINEAYNFLIDNEKRKKSNKNPNEINLIIQDLKVLYGRPKYFSGDNSKKDAIENYLSSILIPDFVSIFELSPDIQKNEFVDSVIILLPFVRLSEKNKYLSYLKYIVKGSKSLEVKIEKIINKQSENISNNNKLAFIGKYWKLIIFILFIPVLLIIKNLDNKKPHKPNEVKIQTPKVEYKYEFNFKDNPAYKKMLDSTTLNITSKWKGNSLKTGESPYNLFFGKGIYNNNYQNRITVKNGQKSDVIVCLTEYYRPNRTIRNEYIRAGESFTMTSVPNGTYYIKTFYGNNWNPNKKVNENIKGFFENDTGFSISNKKDDLIIVKQNFDHYSIHELTLYPVIGGNMESESIDANQFFN